MLFCIFNAIFVPYITITKIPIQTLIIYYFSCTTISTYLLGVPVITPSPSHACKQPTGLPLASWVS